MDTINLIYNHSFSCPDLLEFNLSIPNRFLLVSFSKNYSYLNEKTFILINAKF